MCQPAVSSYCNMLHESQCSTAQKTTRSYSISDMHKHAILLSVFLVSSNAGSSFSIPQQSTAYRCRIAWCLLNVLFSTSFNGEVQLKLMVIWLRVVIMRQILLYLVAVMMVQAVMKTLTLLKHLGTLHLRNLHGPLNAEIVLQRLCGNSMKTI
jgi:hypothetical protein